jgi:glucuronate isomerase
MNPDRLFPLPLQARQLARELYGSVKDLPILSPHGHTDPAWFADDQPFGDPLSLLVQPDHYLLRMLYSQGIPLEELGIGADVEPREGWRRFAGAYYLFRGTPSSLWLGQVFEEVFGLDRPLSKDTADLYFDTIQEALGRPEFRPRALFDRFRIELLATTDGACDELSPHQTIRQQWPRRNIRTFSPTWPVWLS